jgi:hypothetical protein
MTQMTIQFIPPGNGKNNPCKVSGRSYSCNLGATIQVPDFDAAGLDANGWIRCAGHGTGTTAQRPTTGLFPGFIFLDTTVGGNVIWDGVVWRNHVTGI